MAHMISKGENLKYKNETGTDIASGQLVVVGDIVGVAETAIADGDIGTLNIEHIYLLPKAAESFVQGKKVYWDADGDPQGGVAGSGAFTSVEAGNVYGGFVTELVQVDETHARIKINA